MSGFLFLLAMDWIMRKTTADKRREERRCERPFYGIRVETRSKGKRETNDHLEKDCRKRKRQSEVEELECGLTSDNDDDDDDDDTHRT